MSEKTYYQKLQDPRWQKLRLEAMQKADFCCESCFDSKSTLNVHHKDYIKGREPWEYGLTQLSVLCETCHKEHHSKTDPIRFLSTMLTLDGGPWDRHRIAFIIAGYLKIDFKLFCDKLEYEENDWAISMHKLGKKLEEVEIDFLKDIKNEMV
jgi:hypothetical protein